MRCSQTFQLSYRVAPADLLNYIQATAALDQDTEARFQDVIASHFASTTIICVTHRMENFKWCQMKVEMGQGGVVAVTQLR